jgi:hypothetical protein
LRSKPGGRIAEEEPLRAKRSNRVGDPPVLP